MSSVVSEIEGYIKAKEVDTLFKAFLVKCFRQRPSSPIDFFFDYLIENYPEIARAKMGTAPAAPSEDTLEVTVKHMDTEADKYLNSELDIAAVFTYLATQVAEAKPSEPLQFMIQALESAKEMADETADNPVAEGEEDEEEEEEEQDDEAPAEEEDEMADLKAFQARVANHGTRRRISVSAECSSGEALDSNFVFPSHPKSEEDRKAIRTAMADNILFKDLEEDTRRKVEDAVFPMEFNAGDTIIKQGDEGDNFYIVHEGKCEVFLQTGNDPPKMVFTAGTGNSFGELALMYNSPRAATVKAKTPCLLWALDRQTFQRTIVANRGRARATHEEFISKVQILSSLTPKELALVADMVASFTFKEGDVVMHQGEQGDRFYILESGSCSATIRTEGGGNVTVKEYKQPGEYFGELALLTESPRAATITATAPCTLIGLDRDSFNRLLGPCTDILRRNTANYDKVCIDLAGKSK